MLWSKKNLLTIFLAVPSVNSLKSLGLERQATPQRAVGLTLRIPDRARWSRADEDGKRMAEQQVATQSRVGRAHSLVDALRRLEFNLAGD